MQRERELQEVIKEHRKTTLPVRINKEKNSKKRKKLIRMYNNLDLFSPTILTRNIKRRSYNLSLYELAELFQKSDERIVKNHLSYRKRLNDKFKKKEEQPELTQNELFSFGGCGCFAG